MTRPDHHVRSDADLAELWQLLMGDEPFGMHSLWVIFIGPDGLVDPLVVPIDEIPARPNRTVADVVDRLGELLDHVGAATIAFLLARPGASTFTDDDRAWAIALGSVDDPRMTRWPVHLATHGRVRVFAPDDLLRSA